MQNNGAGEDQAVDVTSVTYPVYRHRAIGVLHHSNQQSG